MDDQVSSSRTPRYWLTPFPLSQDCSWKSLSPASIKWITLRLTDTRFWSLFKKTLPAADIPCQRPAFSLNFVCLVGSVVARKQQHLFKHSKKKKENWNKSEARLTCRIIRLQESWRSDGAERVIRRCVSLLPASRCAFGGRTRSVELRPTIWTLRSTAAQRTQGWTHWQRAGKPGRAETSCKKKGGGGLSFAERHLN